MASNVNFPDQKLRILSRKLLFTEVKRIASPPELESWLNGVKQFERQTAQRVKRGQITSDQYLKILFRRAQFLRRLTHYT